MGGAGFPTHVKLSPKEPEKIKYILVNGAECEPYLTSDYRIMLEQPEKLVGGLKVMLQLFDGAKGYICIEDNKPDCIAKMKELVKDIDRIEVKEVMTKYTDEIKNDVLADDMCLDAEGGYSKEWDINGEKVRLGVEKKM